MSVATAAATPDRQRASGEGRVTQARVALSEWTKLRSVRSTRWALFVALGMIVGIGILACVVFASRWPHLPADERLHFRPLRVNLAGVALAQLAIGVLGVLVITGEYSTGMIRSTFSAVPKRLPVLWAKAGVFGAVVFAVSLPAVFIVFFAGQAILSGQHIQIAFSHPGVARALVGSALFLMVMGLFGLGLGAIIRNTAGGIAALAGIVFVLPPIVSLLPSSWADAINPYLPSNAGGAVWTINPEPHTLAPWAGFAAFCAYAAASLAIAAVLLRRRDT
ncbi:MAG: ABC transporter permease [Solirubrobacteraceae bacterium]|nr:MAG: ABC transporter permease [Solirubrobacterales bacterium]